MSGLAALPGWRAVDRPLKILSFGCSTGHECLDIQSVFPDAGRAFGCDVNPEALAEAVARCGPSITIFESSAQALAEHGPFDLVTAFNVFCRYPTTEGKDQIASHFPMSALDEGLTTVDACIRPGGLLAIYNTPYFFEQTCLAAAYEPAPGQDFPDNGWMAKCDADGRRLTTVSVLCEGALHAVPDYARGLRDGRLAWPFGDQRVSVCQQPASEQALPGSTRIVAWRKRSRLDMPVVISFFAGDRYYHDAAAVLRQTVSGWAWTATSSSCRSRQDWIGSRSVDARRPSTTKCFRKNSGARAVEIRMSTAGWRSAPISLRPARRTSPRSCATSATFVTTIPPHRRAASTPPSSISTTRLPGWPLRHSLPDLRPNTPSWWRLTTTSSRRPGTHTEP